MMRAREEINVRSGVNSHDLHYSRGDTWNFILEDGSSLLKMNCHARFSQISREGVFWGISRFEKRNMFSIFFKQLSMKSVKDCIL